MYNSASMGLTIWDQITDDFDHTQLTANWLEIDQHDHSPGNGVQINTGGLADGAVTAAKLAANSVVAGSIGNNVVGTNQIQAGAITASLLANGAVTGAAIAAGAVNWAQLDANVLPLGSVLLWYRGNQNLPGGGWEIMDGRPWSSITNSLGMTTGRIPDMRGIFARGADLTGVNGPLPNSTGGASGILLSHTHAVNPHMHDVPPHTHPIANDGDHYHTWLGGLSMWTRQNAFDIGLTVNDALSAQRQNPHFTAYIKNTTSSSTWLGGNDNHADMDASGRHNHGGQTNFSTDMNTGSASPNTTIALADSISIINPYVALVFIMRCR